MYYLFCSGYSVKPAVTPHSAEIIDLVFVLTVLWGCRKAEQMVGLWALHIQTFRSVFCIFVKKSYPSFKVWETRIKNPPLVTCVCETMCAGARLNLQKKKAPLFPADRQANRIDVHETHIQKAQKKHTIVATHHFLHVRCDGLDSTAQPVVQGNDL